MKPFKLGVTGGIGSGKSVACKILEALGVPVYYADDRAKTLLVENEEVKNQIISLFGRESYEGTRLNRAYLANRVFADPEELSKMNAAVHPAVAIDFEHFVAKHANKPLVAKEAALLFETGSYKELDHTIAVLASKEVRINRVLMRDTHRSKEQIIQIIEKQTSDAKRKKLANTILHNSGTELLIPQVMNVYHMIVKLASN